MALLTHTRVEVRLMSSNISVVVKDILLGATADVPLRFIQQFQFTNISCARSFFNLPNL